MLPGGFSGGDEPDGSGKFIATTFRNPQHRTRRSRTCSSTRDGLMLGICNGFQALIKLGLVPYGKIAGLRADDDPTLTFNTLGPPRVPHGLHARDIGEIPVARRLSRQVMSSPSRYPTARAALWRTTQTLQKLIANGQIATQYVDAVRQAERRHHMEPERLRVRH